ncbi:unnamed protein product [Somion occarium]|uniref:DUF6535 domain-containing protein n=1 Tax=Somion occarium TaxID=3059160 RepID=A0ABP1CVR7_9APHY
MLKKDPMGVSTCLLAQIAQQAGPPSNTSQAQNPSSPVACSDFQAQPLAVHVNILWFASLVCSLVTASIGILVKQWLREYLAGERSSPRERLRLRHVRYEGLVRWRVFEIAALLPLLLQLSLALFFIGLIIFLNALHPTVGQVITVFISVWFFAMLSTTFAPAIAFNCSYKLPSLKRLMQAIRHCWYRAHFVIKQQHFLEELYRDVCLEGADEETIIRQKNDLDIHILVGADATLFDDGILDVTIRECLATTSGEAAFDFVNQTLTHRLDRLRPSRPCEISSKIPECFVHILLDAVNREVESRIDDSSQVTLPPWIGEALTCMAGDGRLSYTFGKASMKDTSIRETTCTALGFLLEAEDHSVARQVILFLGTHTHLQDTLPILSSPFNRKRHHSRLDAGSPSSPNGGDFLSSLPLLESGFCWIGS